MQEPAECIGPGARARAESEYMCGAHARAAGPAAAGGSLICNLV